MCLLRWSGEAMVPSDTWETSFFSLVAGPCPPELVLEYVGASVGEGGEDVGRVSYVGAGECESFDVGWAFSPKALEAEGGVDGPGGEGPTSARARTTSSAGLLKRTREGRERMCVCERVGAQNDLWLSISSSFLGKEARRDQKPLEPSLGQPAYEADRAKLALEPYKRRGRESLSEKGTKQADGKEACVWRSRLKEASRRDTHGAPEEGSSVRQGWWW